MAGKCKLVADIDEDLMDFLDGEVEKIDRLGFKGSRASVISKLIRKEKEANHVRRVEKTGRRVRVGTTSERSTEIR